MWRLLLLTALVAGAAASWANLAAAASRPNFPPALTRQPKISEPKNTEAPVLDSSTPSAEVTFATPQRFAVVVEPRTNHRRLYGKNDLIPDGKSAEQGFVVEAVEAAGLQIRDNRSQQLVRVSVGEVLPGGGGRRLAETTVLDGADYHYVSVKGSVDPEPRILQIRTRRAALVVDTASAQTAVAVAPAKTAGPAQVREYALQTQQRLDATILGKVRVKGAGRDAYEINAADLRTAMNHGEQVLMEAWSTVRPMLSWDQGINFQVKSPIADGVLGPRGFRVTSPNLAERAGLEMGDVVLAVNDQPINGFGDVFRLYRQVKADQRLSMVAVKLERRGQLMTKTYRIR
jgi:hypothetical protein